MNEITTQPEILFSSVTGLGAFLPRPGYEKMICSVYSFHPTLYLGYPGLIPKISSEAAKKAINNLPVGKAISDVQLLHDSDFILRCHFGEFWPIMSLCSAVFESFTEGGRFLRQNRHTFFTQETIQEWIGNIPRLKKQITPAVIMRIVVAEKIVNGHTTLLLSDLDTKPFDNMIGNPTAAKKKAKEILISDNFKKIQKRMLEKELNAFLIALRLFI